MKRIISNLVVSICFSRSGVKEFIYVILRKAKTWAESPFSKLYLIGTPRQSEPKSESYPYM